MPPAVPTRAMLDVAKRFQAYRGDPVQSDQEIIDGFQNTDYVNPAGAAAGAPLVTQLPARPRRRPPKAAAPAAQLIINNFLAMDDNTLPIPDATQVEFGGGPVNWRSVKLLGKGGNGIVGLWEYRFPNLALGQTFRQVAVKEFTSNNADDGNLDWDDEYHRNLRLTGSPHINHTLRNGVPVDAAADGLPAAWDGRIKRLLLEYCPLGDLQGLIKTFQRLGRPMREISVWRLFDCLVDGLSVLQYGNELIPRSPGDSFDPVVQLNWKPIVHFDLKPPNILLAEDKFLHETSPVCKIADFGLAEYEEAFSAGTENQQWKKKFRQREVATDGYFAPEQFTGAWEAKDRKTSGIASVYSYDTNTWGIGCIIYQLMLLSNNAPNPTTPVAPNFAANYQGLPLNGRTYGNALRGGLAVNDPSLAYSNELIDLVQWCLMEIPADRPNLTQLKRMVRLGVIAAAQAGGVVGTPEDWGYFIPAPPAVAGRKELCSGRYEDRTPCRNQAVRRGYCKRHRSQAP